MRAKDKSEKGEEKNKRQYDEYNWEELYLTCGLDKFLGKDLNKYLYHHGRDKAHTQ